ncbi:MAG: hypothetical protein ACOC98_13520 [Thermodesulfobacteriota bacterium]
MNRQQRRFQNADEFLVQVQFFGGNSTGRRPLGLAEGAEQPLMEGFRAFLGDGVHPGIAHFHRHRVRQPFLGGMVHDRVQAEAQGEGAAGRPAGPARRQSEDQQGFSRSHGLDEEQRFRGKHHVEPFGRFLP